MVDFSESGPVITKIHTTIRYENIQDILGEVFSDPLNVKMTVLFLS